MILKAVCPENLLPLIGNCPGVGETVKWGLLAWRNQEDMWSKGKNIYGGDTEKFNSFHFLNAIRRFLL